MGTSNTDHPQAYLLGLATDDRGDLGSLNPTTLISDREPRVISMVSGWSTSFLLDTGVTYSVLREF